MTQQTTIYRRDAEEWLTELDADWGPEEYARRDSAIVGTPAQRLAERLAAGESVDVLVAELDGDGTDPEFPILTGLREYLERLA